VTDQGERYDRIATGYARWWAPVLAPAVAELLDGFEPVGPGPTRMVDIGTGTGQLALGALARWPEVSIVGIDASAGMCAVADAEADRLLPAAERRRFSTTVAYADALPFDDGEFDAALSSFVFQLVPRRARALREVRRVLRPGGRLAYVTWLEDQRVFLPDVTFDDVLEDLGIEARGGDGRSGDVPSVERAQGELRRAGFADVTARGSWVVHRFGVAGLHRLPQGIRRGNTLRRAGACASKAAGLDAPRAALRTVIRSDDDALPDRVRLGPTLALRSR